MRTNLSVLYMLLAVSVLISLSSARSRVDNFKNFQKLINLIEYPNLFSHFKEFKVTSHLYIKQSGQLKKTVRKHSTSLVPEMDFKAMFPKNFEYKLSFIVTPELIEATKVNQTFIQTTFEIVHNGQNYFIESQTIPAMGKFKHNKRQGIEHPLLADIDLMSRESSQDMMIQKMEIYFFQWQNNLSLNPNLKRNFCFGVLQLPSQNSGYQKYFYVRPFAQKVNTQFKQNYKILSKLVSGSQQQINIKIEISSNDWSVLIMHFIYLLTEEFAEESEVFQSFIQSEDLKYHSNQIGFLKKILLSGSMWNWICYFGCIILVCSFPILCCASIIFEVKLFKNAQKFKGISLYGVFIQLFCLVLGLIWSLQQSSTAYGMELKMVYSIWQCLIVIIYLKWKVSKITNVSWIQFTIRSPPWYQSYQQQEKIALKKLLIPSLFFVCCCLAYPFIFQNYSQLSTKTSLQKYLFERLVYILFKYGSVLVFLQQVILNNELKSCNSMSWKYLISIFLYRLIDNVIVLGSNSIWEMLFYFKEELIMLILIYQKVTYGDNLDFFTLHTLHSGSQSKGNQPNHKTE